MLRSYWRQYAKNIGLASAAFLLIALLYSGGFWSGYISGHYEGKADSAAEQYPSDTSKIIDECFKLATRPNTVECVSEATKAAHENQRAEYDLKAQRDMSDWAWWVMVIGVMQFFATIATLGFVKMTLDATLEAVKDTGKATAAMVRQNEIAEQAQRPWVGIDLVPVMLKRQGGALRIEANVITKNLGQMAAKNYQLCFKIILSQEGDFEEVLEAWRTFERYKGNSRKVLLPGDSDSFPLWAYNAIEFIKWGIHDAVVVTVVISVLYQSDVTGDKWLRTDKAFRIMKKVEDGRLSAVLVRNFKTTPVNRLVAQQVTGATLAD